MIDFILKYWLEILFTIISSSVAYMLKGYMSLKNGLKALLKNEIIRIYEKYMELGYCPNYMKDNISEIYKNYQHFEGYLQIILYLRKQIIIWYTICVIM